MDLATNTSWNMEQAENIPLRIRSEKQFSYFVVWSLKTLHQVHDRTFDEQRRPAPIRMLLSANMLHAQDVIIGQAAAGFTIGGTPIPATLDPACCSKSLQAPGQSQSHWVVKKQGLGVMRSCPLYKQQFCSHHWFLCSLIHRSTPQTLC